MHAIWTLPITEKLRTGQSQGFTRLERGDTPGTIRAYLDDMESRFREGDLLRLHSGTLPDGILAEKLMLEQEQDDHWLLTGNTTKFVWARYQGGPCYVDPDLMDLTEFYTDTLEEIAKSAHSYDCLLPLIAGELEPTLDEGDYLVAEEFARNADCNPKQVEAVALAYAAEQVACIQGPPGTGKTRALSLIAKLMVARGQRILMTSHTHMAINNALNKIAAQGVPTVKVGKSTQCKGLDDTIENVEKFEGWINRPEGGYVVGATPFATCSARLDKYQFDVVIFDEASQITLPLALMAMRKGVRFIFIGDQKQLPPVVLSRSVLESNNVSVFSRLVQSIRDHTVMLNETYRMNKWLTAWPSSKLYGGQLVAAGPNRKRRLHLGAVTTKYQQILGPVDCTIFIPSPGTATRSINVAEADLVADLCQAALDGGLPLAEIGIVSPYRSQGRAIRSALAHRFGRAAAAAVIADTVERMQGQERELVVLSLATTDLTFLSAIAGFFFQPERLNVSITRSMTKLVIIGPEVQDNLSIDDPAVSQWIACYRDLIQHATKVAL